MTEASGRCLCGAVEITVRALGDGASACHCAMCRRWSRSAMWGFDVPEAAVTVSGPAATFRSSRFAERAFCATCGSHLWFREDGADYELAPGLFDAAADMPLVREVYADRAFACVPLSGDHRRVAASEYEEGRPHV